MKLRNLIITGILMATMIFAGCGGKSETAKEIDVLCVRKKLKTNSQKSFSSMI